MDTLEIQTITKEIDDEFPQKEFNPAKLALFTSTVHWIADAIIYPVDTLATRIKANTKHFRSMTGEFKHVMKQNGFKDLYRGVNSTFPCSFTPTLVYFMFYENLSYYSLNYIKSKNQDSKFNQFIRYSIPFWIAGFSEAVSLFFYLPFDIVRTRLQVNDPSYQYRSLFQGIKDVVAKEGWLRLYKASHIYITVTTLQTSLQFQFYEMLREYYLIKYHQKHSDTKYQHLNFQTSLAVTTIASGAAAFIGNPLDLLLTRYQIIDSSKQKMSVFKIVQDLVKEEGFKGFFKGITARMLYACGFSLLWMPVYDYYKGQYGVQVDL